MDIPSAESAGYRSPATTAPRVSAQDAALAREIYEAQQARAQREARAQRARDEARTKARARRSPRLSSAGPHLVVRRGGEDRAMGWLLVVAGVLGVALVPGLMLLFRWVVAASVLFVLGVPLAAWLGKLLYPSFFGDLLRLRLTPLHYELFYDGRRYLGERGQLRISVTDDDLCIRATDRHFSIDDLAPSDLQGAQRFAADHAL